MTNQEISKSSKYNKIKENHRGHFSFSAVEVEDVDRKIDSLNASKVIQQNDIPVKIIKANRDIFSEFIMHSFNERYLYCKFSKDSQICRG